MAQKRYSEGFKKRMIQRMVGPHGSSAHALSKEVGVGQPTLSLWLRSAGGSVSDVNKDDKAKPRAKRAEDWSPQEKLSAVMEAAAVPATDMGVWLRRKGLTMEHLRQWQQALEERGSSVFAPREPRASSESRKRVHELERELKRKDKALAETAALLVLQGKMQALWGDEDSSTGPTSDEPSSRASRRRNKRGRD